MRLGFLVSSLGTSQLAYHILQGANASLGRHRDLDIIAFYQNVSKPWVTPLFGLLNISEAYGFSGVVIATSLNTARKMAGFPGPQGRYFYAWDLEWVVSGGMAYEDMAAVYCNPKVPIIARNDAHAALIERCWNRTVHATIDRCDIPQFIRMVDDDQRRIVL